MTRGTTNLVLAIALLALGALAWFKPGATDAPEGELAFPGAAAATLIRVTNTAPGMSYTLERAAGGAWALTAPLRLPADAAVSDALLKDIAEARARARYPASALDPKAVGLDAPSLLVELGEARYAFGGTSPMDYQRYVQHGDQVLMLNDLLYFRFAQGWAALADKRLLPRGARVTKLELPGATISVDAAGKRTLAPDDARVTTDALAAMLDAWTLHSAMELKALDPTLVAQATVRVTLEGQPQPIAFEVLPATSGLRLARSDLGVEYFLPDEARSALLELPRAAATLPAAAPVTGR